MRFRPFWPRLLRPQGAAKEAVEPLGEAVAAERVAGALVMAIGALGDAVRKRRRHNPFRSRHGSRMLSGTARVEG